jgi:hypothetical protein
VANGLTQTEVVASREWRAETRVALAGPVWVTSLAQPGILELARTLDVSDRGARVSASRAWSAEEKVLLSAPPGFLAEARVVYCHTMPNEQFVVGICLDDPSKAWFSQLAQYK